MNRGDGFHSGPRRSRRAVLAAGAVAALISRPAAAEGRALEKFLAERQASDTKGADFPLPAGATVERDIAYGEHRLHRLDLYRPASAKDAPVVVMIHGGAWRLGNKAIGRGVRNKVAHWVGKGWILVSLDYRLLPEAKPLEQAQDVARALAFVQARAAAWGGDASRIVLVGHSSGAHLASLLSVDPALTAVAGARPWRATIALDSAAFDVEQIMRDRHFGFYDAAFGSDPQEWRAASPLHRLDSSLAIPLLAVCSSRRADSCGQAKAFAAKVATLGGRVSVLPVDLAHGEVNERLGTTGAYTEQVDAFLRSAGLP
jgi:arylformamidase